MVQHTEVQGAGEQSQAGALPAGPEEQQPDRGGLATGEEYNNNNNNNNNNEQEDSNAPRGINRLSMVADLLQNESVTSLVQKRKEKQGEDSGLESGHTSMNTASDTQSDSNSVGEDSHAADTGRTSQHSARNNDFDTFNIKTYQRRHQSRYTNLPVTIV